MPSLFKKNSVIVFLCLFVFSTVFNSPAHAEEAEFASSGTAFAITRSGHLVTNYHVVRNLDKIFAFDQYKKPHRAEIVAVDPYNDLAILNINEKTTPLYLDNSPRTRKGSDVSTLGFPNIDVQGPESKFTNGTITAESGLGGDIRFLQISTPIQSGNSGGPLLDNHGAVIGVITSKLSDEYMMQKGSIAQNVNFAVKVQYLLAMVSSTKAVRDLLPQAPAKTVKSREDIAEMAENAVYLIYGEGGEKKSRPATTQRADTERKPQQTGTPQTATPDSGSQAPLVVRIGHVAPTTGKYAESGLDSENGARLAIEYANATNIVIKGRPVKFELVTEDDKGDAEEAPLAARRLLARGVKGVVGHLGNNASLEASKVYFEAVVPQISPATRSARYTRQGFSTAFRTITDEQTALVLLAKETTRNLPAKKIAIIRDGSSYAMSAGNLFRDVAEKNGNTLVSTQTVSLDAVSFDNEIAALKTANPDLIFFTGRDEQAGPLLSQLAKQGMFPKFVGTEKICSRELGKLAYYSIQDDKVFCSVPGATYPDKIALIDSFEQNFKKRFGKNWITYAPYAYDATTSLIYAMIKADSVEPSAYLGYLRIISFDGITSRISFDSNGDLRQAAITLYTYKNNQMQLSSTAMR
ncbi:ABC transporter substrate-binding protein [Undibacterium sp. TS12]|uniref:ABC transporter substrate-binding protein n=1 Tax=Undibacterium sp. TS12 TaxID=2908202 RepID=UPI001F4CA049|nr:ABC transporter substrate-binding protein [Undibacterium sp. TS12]MCH8622346.1 ABC transporter substrate-binding protein [Undibacterium sp. TS12]